MLGIIGPVRTRIDEWWSEAVWRWLSDWLVSPGFAAIAVVVAALIAYGSARVQKRTESWWDTTRWAADHMVDGRSSNRRQVGLAVLQSLARSKGLTAEQFNVIRELTDVALDPLGDGTTEDEEARSSTGTARGLRTILRRRQGGA